MLANVLQNQSERELCNDIAGFYHDPYGYVIYAFPWGKADTDLEHCTGPDEWQEQQLKRVGQCFQDNPEATVREAISSGHGIGKSTEAAWIILWAMSTRPDISGVITANTMNQLNTKTWRELAVWHTRAINKHWFNLTATKFYGIENPDTWFIAATPWSEGKSEAFAGLHENHVLIIYDEASAIPDKIWEVSEGATTTSKAMWFVYGNPTKNKGRFRECFGSLKHRWAHHQIDSRTCKAANKTQIDQWVEDYGEDSDFVRVRVRGEFPRAGSTQFIPSDHVANARKRTIEASVYFHMPVLIGVDVARFGDDQSVICIRQGRKLIKQFKYRQLNTMQLAARVIEKIREFKPQMTFIDGIGVGGGVVDQLSELGYPIYEVNVSHAADDNAVYFNKRAEIWGRMRDWLAGEVDIPDDPELADELTNLEYGYTAQKFQIQLEKKEDAKARDLSSPDCADALALTFAEHVTANAGQHEIVMPDDVEMMDEYDY